MTGPAPHAGPIVIGPFDNVPAPGSPIRSDWAQEISQYVADVPARIYTGTTPGGNVPAGNQLSIGTISNMPAGIYMAFYSVFIASTAHLNVTLRLFLNGAAKYDHTCINNVSLSPGTSYAFAVPVTHNGLMTLTVNLINNGTATASTYPDPANHRFTAMRGH